MTSEAPEIKATTLVRLLQNIKENNVSWMIGALVLYQMGLLAEAASYASGVC